MNRSLDDVKKELVSQFSEQSLIWKSSAGQDFLVLPLSQLVSVLSSLKSNKHFNMLMHISCADFPDRELRFELAYELFCTKTYKRLRVKSSVAENASAPSVVSVWKAANWYEREVYDMYGVKFDGHPNLSRILLHHEFVGHPLRKDYPANYQQHNRVSTPIHFQDESDYKPKEESKLVPLNIGPSHPATHGTLRIMCEIEGEKIRRANVEIGYLHRCFEKMAETHSYNQVIPYTDRLNYCSSALNNITYCKMVEKFLKVEIPPKAQAMRVILSELSRIIDHLVCIGAAAVDLGALTGFFHLFTYREKVYTLFEKLCGARLTVALTRVGGMSHDSPAGWFEDVLDFCKEMDAEIKELDTLLTYNKIWLDRNKDVGSISVEEAIEWGYTGPLLRAAGLPLDLRKIEPCYGYEDLKFDIPYGTTGDCYDRYLVRVEEMRQSVSIIKQVASKAPVGDYTIRNKDLVLPEKKEVYGNIEGLMNHFMLVTKGLRLDVGEIYDSFEAANGELGFYLISDGSASPYRLKVRPPCFALYQSFPEQIIGTSVADVVALLGSMNIVAGELDR